MTTIVNNPAQTPEHDNSESSGSGFLIGIVVFVVFLAVILYFGIPALNRAQPMEINVPAPQVNVEAPEVVAPDNGEVVSEE